MIFSEALPIQPAEKDEAEDYIIEDEPDIYGSVPRKKRCRFDDKCYRENPLHFAQYSHPKREAKKAYSDALSSMLGKSTKVTRTQKKELASLKAMNGVSDDEHLEMLKSVGWTADEYEACSKHDTLSGSEPRTRLPRKRKLE